MFVGLVGDIRITVADRLFKVQIMREAPPPPRMRVSALSGPSLEAPERSAVGEPDETDLVVAAAPRRGGGGGGGGDLISRAAAQAEAAAAAVRRLPTSHGDAPRRPKPVTVEKVGRNDPCPCGSGKKYKRCHGANA